MVLFVQAPPSAEWDSGANAHSTDMKYYNNAPILAHTVTK